MINNELFMIWNLITRTADSCWILKASVQRGLMSWSHLISVGSDSLYRCEGFSPHFFSSVWNHTKPYIGTCIWWASVTRLTSSVAFPKLITFTTWVIWTNKSHIRTHTHTHTHTHTFSHTLKHIHRHIHKHSHTQTYTLTYAYTLTHSNIHTLSNIHIDTHIYTLSHTQTYTLIHTHTHTHTFKHKLHSHTSFFCFCPPPPLIRLSYLASQG
jgi:hypothetical protein